ncbi:RidA family protein [Pedobacter sp. MC2016-14]|uniref:RidA family protein n=1 Tax=Pedobacter sp. MC2016-14 TaxID=2897327 RepID=UPI001E4F024D|nr:RidA family protein [Pedobacter sp. MC2016-14]MCD0489451.1 RidA family protein [Pedobacter sp. MC2016-14]
MRKFHLTNDKNLFDPTPYGFSHTAIVPENSTLFFISGQSGAEDKNHKLSSDFRTQVKFALQNITTILNSNGLKPENVAKFTILIVDHSLEKLQIYNEELKKIWKVVPYPASTLIPVPCLAIDGMKVEIDAIAVSQF